MASETEQFAALLRTWQRDPVAFVVQCLGAKPWRKQREALRAMATHGKVSVRSGHGVGKTALESWVIWWQIVCFDDSLILCTAPTAHQLWDLLWAEVARWRRNMPAWLSQRFKANQDRIVCLESPETWFAVARTARKEQPEGLAGFHVNRPGRLLLVMDEASGIADNLFEVLEGAMSTEGVRALMCGNPTRPDGYFHDSHTKFRDQWYCLRVSCLDAPARIVSPSYPERIAKRYGKDSNVWRVRVMGDFPKSSDDAVIPLEWAEAALDREPPAGWLHDCHEELTLRVDVARFGSDDTVLVAQQGLATLGIWAWHGHDTEDTVSRVEMLAKRIAPLTEERWPDGRLKRPAYYPTILVDDTGVGAGVTDGLRAVRKPGGDSDDRLFTVLGVASGGSPLDKDMFDRRRSELWWCGRLHFQDEEPTIAPGSHDEKATSLMTWDPRRPAIDPELRERLTGELSIPKYWLLPGGKVHVESKDEVKKRLGGEEAKSPDVADAFLLGFYRRGYPKVAPIEGDRWQRKVEDMATTDWRMA